MGRGGTKDRRASRKVRVKDKDERKMENWFLFVSVSVEIGMVIAI